MPCPRGLLGLSEGVWGTANGDPSELPELQLQGEGHKCWCPRKGWWSWCPSPGPVSHSILPGLGFLHRTTNLLIGPRKPSRLSEAMGTKPVTQDDTFSVISPGPAHISLLFHSQGCAHCCPAHSTLRDWKTGWLADQCEPGCSPNHCVTFRKSLHLSGLIPAGGHWIVTQHSNEE